MVKSDGRTDGRTDGQTRTDKDRQGQTRTDRTDRTDKTDKTDKTRQDKTRQTDRMSICDEMGGPRHPWGRCPKAVIKYCAKNTNIEYCYCEILIIVFPLVANPWAADMPAGGWPPIGRIAMTP
jgi:hypothetical protein